MKSLLRSGKLPRLKSVELDFCNDCVMGKLKKITFLKVGKQPKAERIDLVHTDVWGPALVASMGGSIKELWASSFYYYFTASPTNVALVTS